MYTTPRGKTEWPVCGFETRIRVAQLHQVVIAHGSLSSLRSRPSLGTGRPVVLGGANNQTGQVPIDTPKSKTGSINDSR